MLPRRTETLAMAIDHPHKLHRTKASQCLLFLTWKLEQLLVLAYTLTSVYCKFLRFRWLSHCFHPLPPPTPYVPKLEVTTICKREGYY